MKKILIVEDNRVVSDVIRRACENFGDFQFETAAAETTSACKAAARFHPDIVFSTRSLRVETSEELFRFLRKLNPNVQICLLSSYEEPANHSADAFVRKDQMVVMATNIQAWLIRITARDHRTE